MLIFKGASDVGAEKTINEDYIDAIKLDEARGIYLLTVADGAGSVGEIQPAAIASSEISRYIIEVFEKDSDLLLDNAKFFLENAMNIANRVLGAFKVAQESYSGFMVSLTCCLFFDNRFAFAHCGNTRMYMIRNSKKTHEVEMTQLTVDHTEGDELLKNGQITLEQYHVLPERLVLTSGLGFRNKLEIQSFESRIRDDTIFVMSTKGIHFAIRHEPFMKIVVGSENCDAAVDNIISGAKSTKYPDNMSVLVVFYKKEKD